MERGNRLIDKSPDWGILISSFSVLDETIDNNRAITLQNKLISEIASTYLGKPLADIEPDEYKLFNAKVFNGNDNASQIQLEYNKEPVGKLHVVMHKDFRVTFRFEPHEK